MGRYIEAGVKEAVNRRGPRSWPWTVQTGPSPRRGGEWGHRALRLAIRSAERGDLARATSLSRSAWSALRRQPSEGSASREAAFLLGRVAMIQGELDDAARWLHAALPNQHEQTDCTVMLWLGHAAFLGRDLQLARTRWTGALTAARRSARDGVALRAELLLAWADGGRDALRDLTEVVSRASGDLALEAEAMLALVEARSGALGAAQRRLVGLRDRSGERRAELLATLELELDVRRGAVSWWARTGRLSAIVGPRMRRRPDDAIALALAASFVASGPPPVGPEDGVAAIVDAGGAWFAMPGQERVDCRRRPVLRRLLVELAQQRIAHPGRPIPALELFAVGWPDQRIQTASAKNRLKVAISTLRKMGFGQNLVGDRSGYRVSPMLRVRLESSS